MKNILSAVFLCCLFCGCLHVDTDLSVESAVFREVKTTIPSDRIESVNFLDIDNDNMPDILLDGRRLFRNNSSNGKISFTEISNTGLKGGRAFAFDYDNDGWTDIVTTGGNLLRNNHDCTFTEMAEQCNFAPKKEGISIAVGDLDNNGFADIVIGQLEYWNDGNPKYHKMELWLNENGRKFRNIAAEKGLDCLKYTRGLLIFDADDDGRQDIYLANYRLQENMFFKNHGNLNFTEEAEKYNIQGVYDREMFTMPDGKKTGYRYGHSIAAMLFDFDNDGNLDIWVSNLVHKYVGPSKWQTGAMDYRGYYCDDSAIYRNMRGYFKDWRKQLDLPTMPIGGNGVFKGDELWAGATASDINNDTFEDVFVPQIYNKDYAKAKIFLNHHGKKFSDCADSALPFPLIDNYCGAWADIDMDGKTDLASCGRRAVDMPHQTVILQNCTGENIKYSNFRKVILRSSPHQTAAGAVVRMTCGGKTQTRINNAPSGALAQQNDPALHFALPDKCRLPTVEITWPNGKITRHELIEKITVIQAP